MVVVLGVYGVLRFLALRRSGALAELLTPSYESLMFLLEISLAVLLPVGLLCVPRVRASERGLVAAAFLAILGFVMNRLNVAVTGMERAAGVRYLPSWMELTVSVGLVAVGFAAFAVAVRVLPIFPEAAGEEPAEPDDGEAHALGESVPA
jgi:Ni/Fe-hydrogenase subunit HybB-like protein